MKICRKNQNIWMLLIIAVSGIGMQLRADEHGLSQSRHWTVWGKDESQWSREPQIWTWGDLSAAIDAQEQELRKKYNARYLAELNISVEYFEQQITVLIREAKRDLAAMKSGERILTSEWQVYDILKQHKIKLEQELRKQGDIAKRGIKSVRENDKVTWYVAFMRKVGLN